MDWISIKETPPLNIRVKVKTLKGNEYETYFLSEFEMKWVIFRWKITHWQKILPEQVGMKEYISTSGK